MNNPIIKVEHLSKGYTLKHQTSSYQTFRETAVELMKKPFGLSQKQLKNEEFWALQDVNFEVQKGEVIGIIGPNGSGKSTLLKILSQITAPTKGEIIIRGQVASLLEVGTGFHPELTGRENIFLNGSILGLSKKEIVKKFDEIVEFSGVKKFLDTPVKRYSSGMHVRLAFSVAANMEPDILIIDEVLAVGDAEFQKKCLGKMEEITKKEGRTILFVSHNLIAVQKLCSRTVSLEHGKIKNIGITAEVIKKYLTEKATPSSNPQLKTRSDVGSVHFTNIEISNAQGSGIISGDDCLKFKLQYTSNFQTPIADPRIVITVNSEISQQTVLRLDTDVTADSIPEKLSPKGEIACETGPINLSEGKYLVEIDFLIQGSSRDHVVRAAEFDVEANLEKYRYKVKADKTVCDHLIKYSFKQ
jgi:lipopolysaccharide transport system ATP-binding protein